jgi:hypothetical protein
MQRVVFSPLVANIEAGGGFSGGRRSLDRMEGKEYLEMFG